MCIRDRHYSTPTPSNLSDLPPPPTGFLDDLPANHGPPSRAAAAARTPAVGGGGGLAAAAGGSMSRWSGEDVVRWLETLSMPEHCAAFSAAMIDGQRLTQLTDDHLYALGVTQFGQRKMLQRAIMIENRRGDS